MRAWIVRAGRSGEREAWALQNALACGGFSDVPDLTTARTREDVKSVVANAYPTEKPGAINNFAAQLWALRDRIEDGDLVVMPMKHNGMIAIGKAKGGYRYIDDPDPGKRHALGVEWLQTDVPRSAIKQDLLYSLGAFMTVCEVSRNEAAARLSEILKTGIDPGSQATLNALTTAMGDDLDTPNASGAEVDLETAARDRISAKVAETFAGHPMADLVAEILTADGYVCKVSEPGADGGADILAGRGPLGLDPPWLVVQVKSEPTPVGDAVLQALQGAMTRFNATQALLVAPGGLKGPAKQWLANVQFSIRVWDSTDLLDNLLRVYDQLSDDARSSLPLKQIWISVEGDDSRA